MKNIKKRKLIGLITITILVVIDILSKNQIEATIAHNDRVEIINNFFWLTNVRNTGAAWSILEGKTGLLSVISFFASISLIIVYLRDTQSKVTNYALVLMISGTIGNFIDRFQLGYVRDFLSFNIFGYMFPVFNIADSLLVIGVFIVFVEVIFFDQTSNH